MCLSVPGRVLDVEDGDPAFRTARVDFCGVRKTVNLAYIPDLEPGDFVLVHVGFAFAKVAKEEAARIYRDLRQLGALEEDPLALDAAQAGIP